MAFALRKSSGNGQRKKSPLAGWLGLKSDDSSEGDLPALNVQAGVSRALRDSSVTKDAEPEIFDENNPIRVALTSIEATLYAIDAVRDILEQACDVVVSARLVDEPGGRALLAERYDEMRTSIDQAIDDADDRAKCLIGRSRRHIDVNLGGKAHYSVSAMRLDIGEQGLHLSPPRDAFASYEEIDKILDELDNALAKADRAGAGYCRDAQFLIARMQGIAAE